MTGTSEVVALLRRHNLLKSFVQHEVIAERLKDKKMQPQDFECAKKAYLEANNIKNSEDLVNYLNSTGMNQEDLQWQISLPHLLREHCRTEYSHKAESLFLTKKNQLDKVIYSLIRTKNSVLARELYFRIEAGEAEFGDLAKTYSEGPERETKGIVDQSVLLKLIQRLLDAKNSQTGISFTSDQIK